MSNYTAFTSPWMRTKKDAEDWWATKLVEVNSGKANTGSVLTVRDFSTLWLENHCIVNNVESTAIRNKQYLGKYILPVVGDTKLRNLTTQQLDFLFAAIVREGKVKPKTIKNCFCVVHKMLNDAIRWNHLAFNPAAGVTKIKIMEEEVTYFLRDEVIALLVYAKEEYPEEYDIIVYSLNTGCRLGECIAHIWAKIDFETKEATVSATYDERKKKIVPRTKGKRFRKVPLNAACITMLKEAALKYDHSSGSLVFPECSYHAITHQKFKVIVERAGLADALERGVTFHSLRHTFATEFMRRGGNLFELQRLLGHSSIKQTEKYAHFAPDHLAGLTDRISFTVPTNTKVIPFTSSLR